ncbi:carbohydrate ABC transporter substrate-binding protein, CUT1 family [Paramicrobacterium humi]|uniref:Carbohydrate ABC transporter substrate-binding protein, CUT1 family n=1 Tax=Paramicrobacterium humi TaxID=640635 RepID=A0A1H4LME8_9MICO|nr:sugar ABC transporter substrate-binding protein [Microbacterium humi]SEB71445.1 carbohydrate ABC transporter substrate-binding protein, CUT1 family [Microbacterium humi]
MAKRIITAVVAASALLLSGCAASDTTETDVTTVNFRLWDDTVAAAYKDSFAAFEEKNPNIKVNVNVVPWADYWTKLRTDVAGGTMDDVFWINNSYYGAYVDSGNLVDVGAVLGENASSAWEPSVVDQFTRNKTLWGVPQLYDAGIGVYYNKDLLEKAGIDPKKLDDLTWNPDAEKDTFLPAAQKLTLDASGKDAATKGFDSGKVSQYGTNIAYDLQAILLPYIGSNGGTFQKGDEFSFDDPKSVESVSYLVNAINKYHVAPLAADTNSNGDFSLDAFTQGKMAMFQSGLYNLKNISDAADFDWGVASIPAGPAGKVTVTNGIVAAGNAASKKQDAIKKVLAWLGTEEGNGYLASTGSAVPGVVAAQDTYFSYWKKKGVDVSPFFDVVKGNKTIPAPTGPNFSKGFEQYDPIMKEIFAGNVKPKEGLERAQAAANAAIGQ